MNNHDDFFEEPEDLPEDKPPTQAQAADVLIPPVTRICPQCKQEASRIVSDMSGRVAYCGPCQINWPIGPPLATIAPPTMGRGLSKQTTMQPDWDLAFQNLDSETK